MLVRKVDINQVKDLSSRDMTYWANPEKFEPYINYLPDIDSFQRAIDAREKFLIDRKVLVQVLNEQYVNFNSNAATLSHIKSLESDGCYTLTTAHQPSLLTGPIYYILKILSVINLARQLKARYPNKHFVPVFVVGSEDHDFDEISTLSLYGKKVKWEREAQGSVGDLDCEGLAEIIEEVKEILGSKSKVLAMLDQLIEELPSFADYGEFAFRLTHLLFDRLGLVIIRMDHPSLKAQIIDLIKDDLFQNSSLDLVKPIQAEIRSNLGFDDQAYVRDINFYYKTKGARNRIERSGDIFKVLDSEIEFNKDELALEIESHPERFSPNVVTRALYQSKVLPDLAYVGGGGELAYWTERKKQFEYYKIHFPMLIRRTSGMITSEKQLAKMEGLQVGLNDIFDTESALIKSFIAKTSQNQNDLSKYKGMIQKLYAEIETDIKKVDPSLTKTAGAEMSKSIKSIDYLESKLSKALKNKEEVNLNRIKKIKQQLFPNGLQERKVNILQFLSMEGMGLLDELLEHCNPLERDFKVFITQQN